MIHKGTPPLSSQIGSPARIWTLSLITGGAVFTFTLLLQWIIYDDWMHWKGPLRIVGSTLAGALASMFAAHWQSVWRMRKIDLLKRIQIIAQMNDRIRNALQAIQYVDYAVNLQATESVENAVRAIDHALNEVLTGTHTDIAVNARPTRSQAAEHVTGSGAAQFVSSKSRLEGF